MNWKSRECYYAPLLEEQFSIMTPDSFYRSFALVFGSIRSRQKAFEFVRIINGLMNKKKGGERLTKEAILTARDEAYDVTEFSVYDKHHVKPTSRDSRPDYCKFDQVVELPAYFHAGWHGIFHNLWGEEIIIFLKKLFYFLRVREVFEYCEYNKYVEGTKGGKLCRV